MRIFFCVLALAGFWGISQGQTLYSRASGAWDNTNTWSTTGHLGGTCGCTPSAGATVLIGGNNHQVRIPPGYTGTVANITVDASGLGGTLLIGDATNTAINLTITGNVTINSGGTFRVDGDGAGAITHTINFGGSITNNNVFNLIGASANDRANAVFNGSSLQTLSGTGTTFTFYNLTLNSGGNNLEVNNSIFINGPANSLVFSANGQLIVGSNSNLTLGITATAFGFNASRYIQLDGINSDNSQLIKITNNNVTTWRIVYPIGTATGGYTPVDLSSSTITNAPTNNSTLAVKAIYNPSVLGQLRRVFRLVVSGNTNATTLANGNYHYNAGSDVSSGDVLANYNTAWFLNFSTGGWTTVAGTAPGGTGFFTASSAAQTLTTGTYYYTIGTSTAYPNTWYSYQTGNWSNPDIWTLDPSVTTLLNPLSQSPQPGDEVVIVNGFTVTVDLNNIVLGSTTIQAGGILDMDNTTGHTLGAITGAGLLRIRGTALPSGAYASFVAPTGGTIEYYNTSGTLSATQTTYNNLLFTNNSNSAVTFITASNLTVNGNLNVTQTGGSGTVTWQINDGANTQRTISLAGNLIVSANGRIRAGAGNPANQHNLTIFGNLTNEGSIKFFDDTFATLSEANYTSGAIYTSALTGRAVNVTFSGLANTTVTCNNQTDFYRLIVDKGTGQQAMLTVNSSDAANFRLFGPNNQNYSGTAPQFISNNNLSIQNGTLQLTGAIDIPSLVVNGGAGIGGGWPIPQSGALWMNSPNVNIQVTNTTDTGDNGRQVYVFGLLRVTNGTITTGYSRGLLGGGSGTILVEGGTVNTWQFRTTYLGTGNNFAYIQTGGTVNVGTTVTSGVVLNTYPRFALPYTTCSFTMTGGTLNVGLPTTGGVSVNGGIMIKAATSNIEVTGGTVNAYLPPSNINFTITSTAPFYNINIIKPVTGGTSVATLNAMTFDDADATNNPDNLAAQPLVVLNDLTLVTGNSATLNCNSNNLTVGRDLTVQAGTTLTAGTNTITFNGTGDQLWTNDGTVSTLANATVVMTKPAGVLTLAGGNAIPSAGTIGNLVLNSGTLNDGGKTLNVTASLSNSAIHTGSGLINVNGPTTIGGNNGTFATLRIETNGTVTVTGNQTVTNNLRLFSANSTLDIGLNNLTVLGGIFSNDAVGVAFGNTKRIITRGLRNDGGLSRAATSGVPLLFPVGSPTIAYTPVTINVTATTVGRITVQPVAGAHPNVTTTNQSVQYYWRVSSTGFAGITSVAHNTYTYSTATRNNATVNYRPARYDGTTFTWAYGPTYNATAAPGTTTIPNFSTGTGWTGLGTDVLDGEYTAGNLVAFGSVTVYYSRTDGQWGTPATWSNTAVGGPANAVSQPCATCPVVIGNGVINHTITAEANTKSCGSLEIATGSTLDLGTTTGHTFGVNTGAITGRGTLRIASAVFPAGDFTNFIGPSGGRVEWYGATKTIPATSATIALGNYYDLLINPNAGQTITLPATNLTVYNDLITSGNITATNVAAARTVTVNNNISVNSGTFQISSNTVAFSSTFIVNGDINIASGSTMQVQNASAGANHALTIQGSIINNGTLNFRPTANHFLNATFTGNTNTSFTGTNGAANTTLSELIVNKGSSQSPVLTFDVAGTVTNGLASGWLTLTNGTMHFNKTATFTLINAGANSFSIPSSARLMVSSGTVNITTANDNGSDLLLAGTLEVNGGTVNVGNAANNVNNDVQYASAGLPSIVVSGGTLYVNGAVRRPTTTLAGSLVYNQTSGTVIVGGRNCTGAPNNTRLFSK